MKYDNKYAYSNVLGFAKHFEIGRHVVLWFKGANQ